FERGSRGKVTQFWEEPDAAGAMQDGGLQIAAAADRDVARLLAAVREARHWVKFLDPVGVGARDLRECLLIQICAQQGEAAIVLIRRLDRRLGQGYSHGETWLIGPDVGFVKRDYAYVVVMNEEDMATLRLNQSYRKMLQQKQTEKEVKGYVKERYKSAIQL